MTKRLITMLLSGVLCALLGACGGGGGGGSSAASTSGSGSSSSGQSVQGLSVADQVSVVESK